MSFKIAICGPSGAGKTTLALHISSILGISYIHTNGPALREKYGCKNHKEIIKLSATDPQQGYCYQQDLLEERSQLAEQYSNFVMDRSPIDNVVYFMLQNSMNHTTEETYNYIGRAVSIVPNYTHFIFIPPMYDSPEEDGVRVQNTLYQKMTWAMMEYCAKEYFAMNLRTMQASLLGPRFFKVDTYDLEERRKQVINFLL